MRYSTENVNCEKCGLLIGKGEEVQYARRGPLAGKRFHPGCYPNRTEAAAIVDENGDADVEISEDIASEFAKSEATALPGQSKSFEAPKTHDPLSGAIVNAIWPSLSSLIESTKATASEDSTAAVQLANEYTDNTNKLTRELADLKITESRHDLVSFVDAKFDQFKSEFKPEISKVTFSVPSLPEITLNTPHPQLPKLIKSLQLGMIPYLYGQAGSGKTHAALGAAVIFGYTPEESYVVTCNPFNSPIELIGYTDAHGKQVDKAFIRAFRDGGFIILDEADRARPDFLPALNSALANKQLVSPDGTIVRQHERFMLVLTGNTTMHGQSKSYNSAARQDASVLDRLFYIEWFIDEKLETSLAIAIDDSATSLVELCQRIRAFVSPKSGNVAEVNVTMRGVLSLVKANKNCEGLFTQDELLNATIFKGIAQDTIERINQGVEEKSK